METPQLHTRREEVHLQPQVHVISTQVNTRVFMYRRVVQSKMFLPNGHSNERMILPQVENFLKHFKDEICPL